MIDIGSLPQSDLRGRLGRVRDMFEAAGPDRSGIDALLVTRLVNIRYLTGFTGSAAMLLVLGDDALFVTDGRYKDQSVEQLSAAGIEARVEIGATAAAQLEFLQATASRVGRLGLEASGVTWSQQLAFAASTFSAQQLVPTEGVVEGLRRAKDDGEIARIAAACGIGDAALAEVLPRLNDHPTEREFALELEFAMRRRGATGTSFDPIVASGPNAAKPHARPSDRRIGDAELLILDFGCVVDGYCSDMTRTVSLGEPTPAARAIWELVRESQQAGRDAVRAGAEVAAVDKATRDIIAAAGWGEAYVHGTGHGVGLEIHEAPRVGQTARDTLAEREIVTVEPGVYLTGIGGVRIEDTVVVTHDGCEALTHTPKTLVL